MGKASSQTMMVSLNPTTTITKKKKGRPSRQDLQNRAILQQQQQQQQLNLNQSNPNSLSPPFPQNPNLHLPRRPRSTRRIPIFSDEFVDGSDFDDDDDDGDDDDADAAADDDDERVEKKVKLVGRLPNSSLFHTDEINAATQDEKGTSIQAVGPTTTTSTNNSLPHKKLLLLILDKLQKKDTRGVFAEPVDPEELPDYHEVIENPMDFETVRKKLDCGLYLMLEQFEADIYLICSNAMQYNAPCTIFFRQARSIQELAKKEFETLRQDGGQSEPPPKPRRGRPPGSRNLKKLLESSSVDRGVPESASDATLVPQDDDAARSNSYNLRKGPSLYRFPRNLETCFDFPAFSSRSMSTKYGKKHYESDESRRETYNLSGQVDSCNDPSLLTTFETFENELIPVGLDSNHSYARSLARFSGDLGLAVWRIVSKKIKSVLPPGVEFGPGWVNDNKASSSMQFSPLKSEPHYPSTSNFTDSTCSNENSVEARGLSPVSEWSSLKGINAVMGSRFPFQIQRGPVFHSGMNGITGGFGSGFHFQPPKSHFLESGSLEASRNFHGSMNTVNDLGAHGMPYWESPPVQERWDKPYPSDSNVGFQASSSRSSRVPIGSPPQLDLVLQL